MASKKPILFLIFFVLGLSLVIPAIAQTRPDYLIDPNDVPGWYLYKEGHVSDQWNWSGSAAGFIQMDAWYQIWINN
ncbi:MAG: hypothetical protein ACTSRS_04155 [Candidatus Helarchaeota archaeon]